MNEPITLFQQKALDHQKDGWMGEIVLVRPLRYAILTAVLAAMAIGSVIYMVAGSYTKKARVSGYIVPDQGLLKVYPQAPGFIVALRVADGDVVKEGQVLAVITTERTGSQGNTQEEIAKKIEARRRSLKEQTEKTHVMYGDLIASVQRRLVQLKSERQEMTSAIVTLKQRVANAERVVARHTELRKENFISELGLAEKESDLLDQKNRLNDMVVRLSSTERDITQAESDLETLPFKERNDLSALERSVLELDGDGLENEARRQAFVLAPQSGTVTQLLADKGRGVSPTQPLMNLIPTGSRLQASLYVPSRSIAFIHKNTVVQMQLQPFPYQKFGVQRGTVVGISRTSVPATELPFPVPPTTDVFYVVTVQPDKDYVMAYGNKEPLQPGMQLDADIWLDKRTILEQILEPLFSITGRMS